MNHKRKARIKFAKLKYFLCEHAQNTFLIKLKFILILYRVSQEEWAKLRESVPCVKIYRYNPEHL